jgi:hypothetical protein
MEIFGEIPYFVKYREKYWAYYMKQVLLLPATLNRHESVPFE